MALVDGVVGVHGTSGEAAAVGVVGRVAAAGVRRVAVDTEG